MIQIREERLKRIAEITKAQPNSPDEASYQDTVEEIARATIATACAPIFVWLEANEVELTEEQAEELKNILYPKGTPIRILSSRSSNS